MFAVSPAVAVAIVLVHPVATNQVVVVVDLEEEQEVEMLDPMLSRYSEVPHLLISASTPPVSTRSPKH